MSSAAGGDRHTRAKKAVHIQPLLFAVVAWPFCVHSDCGFGQSAAELRVGEPSALQHVTAEEAAPRGTPAVMTRIAEKARADSDLGEMGFIPAGTPSMAAAADGVKMSFQPMMCEMRVLNALNERFPKANLTLANVAPDTINDPDFAVANVNIYGSATQLADVNKGRYAPHHMALFRLVIGYGPSLHIVSHPSLFDPHALVFSKTLFTAHLDSAWADTPVGMCLHFFLDVLRPKKRNPCP